MMSKKRTNQVKRSGRGHRKLVISLSALGLAIPSISLANVTSEKSHSVVEGIQKNINLIDVNPATMETLRQIDAHSAFLFNEDGSEVYIDLLSLPEELATKVSQSKEVKLIPEADLVKLDQSFSHFLATKNAFKRTESPEGHLINEAILESLKANANPVLRKEMLRHRESSFIR